MHYVRKKIHGSEHNDGKVSLADRFWAKVDKTETCWLWTASLGTGGYGQINVDRKPVAAHRISWKLTGNTFEPGKFLDHICHVRHCVNPQHLRQVTDKENVENTSLRSDSSSGVRGVGWSARNNRWIAKVIHHGRQIQVGSFIHLDDAERAVIAKRKELFTHNDADR